MSDQRYNIVRYFRDSDHSRIIKKRVTLEVAQRHCNDPESNSDTCTTQTGRARALTQGPWFDSYVKAD